MSLAPPSFGDVSPLPADHRRFEWTGGVFESAHRPFTRRVEGRLRPAAPVLMVTLRGGADRHESRTDDGGWRSAPDKAGAVSFLPAGCARQLQLVNVAWHWAAVTLPPAVLDEPGTAVAPFSVERDDVVRSVLAEMVRLHDADRSLDALYCDTMTLALARHVARRYWRSALPPRDDGTGLPAWRLRRVIDYVEAHLDEELRIATLASLAGLSPGHFQRAFKAATGRTPLAHVTLRRLEAAKRLLATTAQPVTEIAPRVGFVSQSHLARVFRTSTGVSPTEYRRRFAAAPR